ncbi:class I SAM-dependent methyltransferase [Microvirga sp. RSM25]|uniref:class I SAM-dependent methyltransferase n=1 Tax=Microvirga sp. RSM25 TaxID=3273802 RepID=UPI00384CD768
MRLLERLLMRVPFVAALSADNAELLKQCKSAENRLEQNNSSFNALNAERNHWKWATEALERETALLKKGLEQSNSSLDTLNTERNQWQWTAEALGREVASLKDGLERSSSSLNALNAERNRWHWSSESLQRQVDAFRRARSESRLFEFDYAYHPHLRDWDALPQGNLYRQIISARHDAFQTWITAFASLAASYAAISYEGDPEGTEPFWNNGWFPPLDGICLYGLIARTNPRLYIEVGSGNSTKFVRRAINDHGLQTKVISIDPYPRANIDALCDEVIRTPFENIDLSRFQDLQPGDIMFVDNSHRSFQNSDVTVFFTEVLPLLKPGVIWGVHDIFLPLDYPDAWSDRLYNEQYLLMTYLLGGAGGDEIELPVAYLAQNPYLLSNMLAGVGSTLPWAGVPLVGGAFWMRKA